jgi:hypothetical protein
MTISLSDPCPISKATAPSSSKTLIEWPGCTPRLSRFNPARRAARVTPPCASTMFRVAHGQSQRDCITQPSVGPPGQRGVVLRWENVAGQPSTLKAVPSGPWHIAGAVRRLKCRLGRAKAAGADRGYAWREPLRGTPLGDHRAKGQPHHRGGACAPGLAGVLAPAPPNFGPWALDFRPWPLGCDPGKLAIAARLRSETTLPIKCIAARVQIGTAKGDQLRAPSSGSQPRPTQNRKRPRTMRPARIPIYGFHR